MKNLKPPYYAVIFTTKRTEVDEGYADMSAKVEELAKEADGFLGLEFARNEIGITVSYWRDREAIKAWSENIFHREAKKLGKEKWYAEFHLRICKVEHEVIFPFVR